MACDMGKLCFMCFPCVCFVLPQIMETELNVFKAVCIHAPLDVLTGEGDVFLKENWVLYSDQLMWPSFLDGHSTGVTECHPLVVTLSWVHRTAVLTPLPDGHQQNAMLACFSM